MKKTVCFKVNKPYRNNFLFSKGGDLDFYYQVKNILEKLNFKVGTQDIIDENIADYIICLDYRKDFKKNQGKSILIAFESIAVLPQTFEINYLNKFDYVFTWNNNLIDDIRVFPLNFSFILKNENFIDFKDKKKLICNISANKFSNHKNELYSERIKAIEFFNNNYPDQFDLFGYGWESAFKYPNVYNLFRIMNNNKYLRGIKRLILFSKLIDNLIYTKYDVFRGSVDSKLETLKHYKFSICYENIKNIEGYITEKIFDCFKAGVIPIYIGPKNIKKIIPSNTYIERNNFDSYEDLLNFLKNINYEQYEEYMFNIKKYLYSEEIKKYESTHTANYFVKKLLSLI